MGILQATTRAPRCSLTNLATNETLECLFNPTQLTEKLGTSWNRVVARGMSHQVLQFESTQNRQLTGLEFYLDKMFASAQPGQPDIMYFRNFLRALTVPENPPAGTTGAAPPRVLFVWPRLLAVEAILVDVEFQYRQFATDGTVLVYVATCTLEEIADVRISSAALRGGSA